jgi:hypothetical protein
MSIWDMLLIFLDRYLRALAAMYIRMTFRAVDVYEMLEPLLKDYRKLRHLDMGILDSHHILIIVSNCMQADIH